MHWIAGDKISLGNPKQTKKTLDKQTVKVYTTLYRNQKQWSGYHNKTQKAVTSYSDDDEEW